MCTHTSMVLVYCKCMIHIVYIVRGRYMCAQRLMKRVEWKLNFYVKTGGKKQNNFTLH